MLPFSVTNILQCTYIHTHLFHQFRGLIPGNPINNLKFPHFPLLQATLTTVCREVEDAHHTQSPKQFTWKEARNTTENMQPPRAPLVQTLQKAAQGTVLFSCTALSCTDKQPCPKAHGRHGKQPKLRFNRSFSKRWNFTTDTILRLCFLSVISILYSAITLAGRTKYLYQSAWDKVHRLWIFLPISTRHQQEVYAKCCLAFPVLAGYRQL